MEDQEKIQNNNSKRDHRSKPKSNSRHPKKEQQNQEYPAGSRKSIENQNAGSQQIDDKVHSKKQKIQSKIITQAEQQTSQPQQVDVVNEKQVKRQGSKQKKENNQNINQINGSQKGVLSKTQKQRKKISVFDKLEEVRFQSYETGELLKQLLKIIEEYSKTNEEDYFSAANFLFTIPPKAWDEIRKLAQESQKQFSTTAESWDSCVEQLTQETNKWKAKCQLLKNKIDFLKTDSQVTSSDWIDREKQFEKSIKEMASVYDINRNKIFNVMDEMELAVHDLKNAREKLNIKHLGSLTHVEQEMDTIMRSFMTSSGKINLSKLNSARALEQESRITLETGLEKTTPRSMIPKVPSGHQSRRGKSQNAKGDTKDVNKKVSIPPLPIQLIHQQNGQNSHRGAQQLSSRQKQLLQPPKSSRRLISNRGQLQSIDSNDGQVQHTKRSARPLDSQRSNSVCGGVIGDYLVHPVMLACVAYKTSEFDKGLEDDFEGAGETLPFETDRLKQFDEEYQMLMSLEDEEQKILVKQWLFFQHEKELKDQAKQQRLVKLEQKKQRKLENPSLECTTPRGQNKGNHQKSNDDNEETLKDGAKQKDKDRKKGDNGSPGDQNEDDDVNLSQLLGVTGIKLESPLSSFDACDLISARRKNAGFHMGDAQLTQILDVPQEISGLKTVTEKHLILLVEQSYQSKQQLHQEDRKVLEWSSSESNNNQQDKKAPKKNLYNNNAINIIDMQDQSSNCKKKEKQNVGNLEQSDNQEDFSSSSFSLQSSQVDLIINQSAKKEQKGIEVAPHIKNTIQKLHEVKYDQQEEIKQQKVNKVSPYKQNKNQRTDKNRKQEKDKSYQDDVESSINDQSESSFDLERLSLDIIQERQSEFTNSNGLHIEKIQSNRSKSRQQTPSSYNFEGNVVVLTDRNKPSGQIVQSARASKQVNHEYISQKSNFSQMQRQESNEELMQNRARSHRQSLYSAPNSQRNKIQSNKPNKDLLNINNFYSIQVDDSMEDDLIQDMISKRSNINLKRANAKSVIHDSQYQNNQLYNDNEPSSKHQQQSFREADTASFREKNIVHNKKSSRVNYDQPDSNSSSISNLRNKQGVKRSKINSLEESKEMNQQQDKKHIFKSSSEILLREGQKLFGSQLERPQELQMNYLLPFEKDESMIPSRQQLITGNINDSQLLAEGPPTANMFCNQSQFTQAQYTRKQLTNNLIAHFLSQQTQQRMQGQSTRDAPTCKKGDVKEVGNPMYSFATLSEDTLLQMFPQAKRTLLMMQNFHNNYYYNNQAGVLFTMHVTDEMNNAFLRQCQTVLSDPNLLSGDIGNQNQMRNNHLANQNTQESMIQEEDLAKHFSNQPHFPSRQFSMSRVASSTEDSAFKSMNIPARFHAHPQQLFSATKEESKNPHETSGINDSYQINSSYLAGDSSVNIQQAFRGNKLGQNYNQVQRISLQRTKVRGPNMQLNLRHQETSGSSNTLINSLITRGSSTRAGNASSILFKGSQDLASISPAAGSSGQPNSLLNKNFKIQAQKNQQRHSNIGTHQNLIIKRNNIKISSVTRQNDSDSSFTQNNNNYSFTNQSKNNVNNLSSIRSSAPGMRFFDKSKIEDDVVSNL